MYCDFCPEGKILAINTCLKCEVSLCKEHVKPHSELPVFTGHPLVVPVGDLQQRKCPQHEDMVLRYYCNASRHYICNMCALESKRHNLATDASTVLRRQMTVSSSNIIFTQYGSFMCLVRLTTLGLEILVFHCAAKELDFLVPDS